MSARVRRTPVVGCRTLGCERHAATRGLCSACYQRERYRRAKAPGEALKPWPKANPAAEICPKCGASNAHSIYRTCKDCTREAQAKDGRKAGGRGRGEGEL